MLSASLCFTLRSFSILFLRDALDGFSFRARWDYVVRVQQVLDRLLLFGKKLVLGVSLRSHLVPFDILGALQRVPPNLLAFLLFSLRLLAFMGFFRLGMMVLPRELVLSLLCRPCHVLLELAIFIFITFPCIHNVQPFHKVLIIEELFQFFIRYFSKTLNRTLHFIIVGSFQGRIHQNLVGLLHVYLASSTCNFLFFFYSNAVFVGRVVHVAHQFAIVSV